MKVSVDEIKNSQGFTKESPKCPNCAHFKYDEREVTGISGMVLRVDKTMLRCGLGGFKVGLSCWCKNHEFKQK